MNDVTNVKIGIDEKIAEMTEEKHLTDIITNLKNDLIERNIDFTDTWDKVYSDFDEFFNCKNLIGTERYYPTMKKIYIDTYKACIADFEKNPHKKIV